MSGIWFPSFGSTVVEGEITPDPEGWRITTQEEGKEVVFTYEEKDLLFGRQLDCQLACDELNALELTMEQLVEMSDGEFGSIVTKRLQW